MLALATRVPVVSVCSMNFWFTVAEDATFDLGSSPMGTWSAARLQAPALIATGLVVGWTLHAVLRQGSGADTDTGLNGSESWTPAHALGSSGALPAGTAEVADAGARTHARVQPAAVPDAGVAPCVVHAADCATRLIADSRVMIRAAAAASQGRRRARSHA